MDFAGIGIFWGENMMHLDSQEYGPQAGITKTVIMSESSFFERISASLTDNKRKRALEAEVKIMAIEENEEVNHTKGPGVYFKPKTPDKEKSVEEKDQRLDAI